MANADDKDRGLGIFNKDGNTTDKEIVDRVRAISGSIITVAEVKPSKVEAKLADSIVFHFEDYPRIVYCSLTNLTLSIWQTEDYRGTFKFTFDQDCNSRKGDRVKGSDWRFSVDIYSESGNFLAWIFLGAMSHGCGKRGYDFSNSWEYSKAPNLPKTAKSAILHWWHENEVSGC